jgi:Mg2+ and Co2+ transporter CorA
MKQCESLTKAGCNALLGDATYKGLYALMESLLDFSDRQLKHIENKLVKIEERVFHKDQSEDLIYSTLNVKRDIVDFRRIFMSLHSCLDAIEFRGEYF